MKKIIQLISFIMLSAFCSIAFAAKGNLPACISKNYGGKTISANRIIMKAPEIAENGAVVGVGIDQITGLKKGEYVKELSIYNEFRAEPVATFFLSESVAPANIKTRVRLRESSNLYAVAKLDNGDVIGGSSFVKVTIGGCGGGGDSAETERAPRVCKQK